MNKQKYLSTNLNESVFVIPVDINNVMTVACGDLFIEMTSEHFDWLIRSQGEKNMALEQIRKCQGVVCSSLLASFSK